MRNSALNRPATPAEVSTQSTSHSHEEQRHRLAGGNVCPCRRRWSRGRSSVYQQDWRSHQFGDPQPPVLQTRFSTHAEAIEQKNMLRKQFPDANAVLLCVVPMPTPTRGKPKRNGKRRGLR